MFNFIGNVSPTEIGVIIMILILLFGSRTMKALGKMSGETVREVNNIKNAFIKAVDAEPDDDKPSKKTPKEVLE